MSIIWVKTDKTPDSKAASPAAAKVSGKFSISSADNINITEDLRKKISANGVLYPNSGVKPKIDTKLPMEDIPASYINSPSFGGTSLDSIMDKLNNSLDIQGPGDTVYSTFQKQTKKYNRYKYPLPNIELSRGFGHVFFVKPSCNLFEDSGRTTIRDEIKKIQAFDYIRLSSPDILKELSNGGGHSIMLSLSNYAKGFSLNDEELETDKYGRTYAGYEINYGKHSVASKASGTVTVSFKDDKNLNIYKLIKMWVDYIEGCYRGRISPTLDNIINKIIDYAGAMYYILTDEGGENIIFWSKYYGIFPTTIPSSQYSWRYGSVVNPESTLDVAFRYSFKEDYNPYALMEFNTVARANKAKNYMPIYDASLGTTSTTWVGIPYIDLVKDSATNQYIYKLRFRK